MMFIFQIKGSFSAKRGQENFNPFSQGSILRNCLVVLCGPTPPRYDLDNFVAFQFFLAHLTFRPSELLPSLFVCRPSVNISHFLLRNHWANCNQTLVEWSLGGPPLKIVSGDPDFQSRWPPS
jgi:hypothetical protein